VLALPHGDGNYFDTKNWAMAANSFRIAAEADKTDVAVVQIASMGQMVRGEAGFLALTRQAGHSTMDLSDQPNTEKTIPPSPC
jgi:hypothetical protein